MDKELWKNLAGYEGVYQISNMGRVKSFAKGIGVNYGIQESILKPSLSTTGYFKYVLCRNKIKYNKPAHRLVAETFIPNPNNYSLVCHKDGNPKNNNSANLYWGTQKMNMGDKKKHGTQPYLKGEMHGLHKLTEKQVLNIRKKYSSEDITFVALANLFGVSARNIKKIIDRQAWTHLII